MERAYRYVAILLFVGILALVPFGFRHYFARVLAGEGASPMTHVHLAAMFVWCVLLIVQPTLIRLRRLALHRTLGKVAYGLVPILVFTMLAMIAQGIRGAEVRKQALADALLPFWHTVLFAGAYAAAMVQRKQPKLHMRWIIVSSLTLLGPTIGRLDLPVDAFSLSLLVMEGILLALIGLDLTRRAPWWPYGIGLCAYGMVHVAVYHLGDSGAWLGLASRLFP